MLEVVIDFQSMMVGMHACSRIKELDYVLRKEDCDDD